jgi:hypothetical protein
VKKILIAAAFGLPFAFACSAQVDEPTQQSDQSVKVCPYLVPYCPSDSGCKLVGGCPQQCVCNGGQTTLCGTQHCNKNEYCCTSTTVGDECLAIGTMCPL